MPEVSMELAYRKVIREFLSLNRNKFTELERLEIIESMYSLFERWEKRREGETDLPPDDRFLKDFS